MPISILSVFGTRPEAIKMAPVVKALEEDPRFDARVLVTAQHREMLDQVLETFSITADYDLDIMKQGQSLAQITGRVLSGVTKVLEELRPSIVVVHGDTTTTFATALAAFYLGIDVAHIEAGMRTGDPKKPFPEEINRRLVASLAQWHFAPSAECESNLLKEGVSRDSIIRTRHNTGVDALLLMRKMLEGRANPDPTQQKVLVTAHRRESWGEPMREIFSAIAEIAYERPEVLFEVATHANPLVANDAEAILGTVPNVALLGHQDYADFVSKMAQARVILSDSGGVQEEGPTLGVPVIVMRDKTEYHELMDAGVVVLAGTKKERIVQCALNALDDEELQRTVTTFAEDRGAHSSIPEIIEVLAESENS